MKLNKYLYEKLDENDRLTEWGKHFLTEERIEKWIVEWYRSEFNAIGCDGTIATPRMPPSWLAKWSRDEESESK